MSFKVVLATSFVWCTIGFVTMVFQDMNRSENTSMMNLRAMSDGVFHGVLGQNGEEEEEEPTMEEVKEKAKEHEYREFPNWMYKHSFMEDASKVDYEDRICFVHVGKTAGSTLACYLGFEYSHCGTGFNSTSSINIPSSKTLHVEGAEEFLAQFIPPHSLLAHHTTSVMHREWDACKVDKTKTYLFIVRDPLDRLRSWFEYERPIPGVPHHSRSFEKKRPLFVDCGYDTFAKLGGHHGLGAKNKTLCSRRAWRAATGFTGYSAHNMFNYGFYYHNAMKHAPKDKKIIVVRTEHLEQDWSSIERDVLNNPAGVLGDDTTFIQKNKSPKRIEDLELSESTQNNICNALCEEIQVYKKILQQAENLSKEDYAVSMHELAAKCPNEAGKESCW